MLRAGRSISQLTSIARRGAAAAASAADTSSPQVQRAMSFELNDQERRFQDAALTFAKEVIAPEAAKYDQSGEFPWPIVKQAHEMGFMCTQVPEEFGGQGMTALETTVIGEALAYGCSGIQLAIMGPWLALTPLLLAGNHEQKKKWAGMLTAEPLIASYCVTEPGAGSDVNGTRTKAEAKGK